MAQIKVVRHVGDSDKLGVKIVELEHSENKYDGFRVQINKGDYINISKLNSGHKETATIVISDLQPVTPYRIDGQVCYNGEWIDVIGATFVTSPNHPNPPKKPPFKTSPAHINLSPKVEVI
jgi:hypothetical protein